MNTSEIELAIASSYNVQKNLIVPGITNTMGIVPFEVDMLVLSERGYATGFEIKISKSDLRNDLKKRQWRDIDNPVVKERFFKKFKYFNYAIPESLEQAALDQIPEWCGLYVGYEHYGRHLRSIRQPSQLYANKWTDKEMYEVARLGTMRMHNMRRTIVSLLKENKRLRNLEK